MEIQKVFLLLRFLIIISFTYSVVELYLQDYFSSIIYSLYKREWRVSLQTVSTTFFMTSYYSGFVFFSIFLLFFSKALTENRVSGYLWCIPLFILIMFAQSKTMIFSTIICMFIAVAFLFRKFFFISFPVVIFSFLALVINIDLILVYFDDYNLRVVKQLRELIFNYNESETLAIRTTQIFESFVTVSHNGGILGEGLSPQSSLESWVALFLYRYGILGVLNFLAFSVFITFFSLKLYNYKTTDSKILGLALFLWGGTLPITQLSSAMIEFGKTAYVSNFMLALLCSQLSRCKDER